MSIVKGLHLLREVEDLGLVALGDVDLGEGDRAVGVDLTRVVVRTRDGDAFHGVDLGEDAFHRRLHLGVVDSPFALVAVDDLAGEAGIFGTDGLELVDHLLRLGAGEVEVGAERRAGGRGGDVDADQNRYPDGEDRDPFVRDTPTRNSCKHAHEATRRGVTLSAPITGARVAF